MNEFFKFLIPQLLEYFNNDKEMVKEFLPLIVEKYYGYLLEENNTKKLK